MRGGKGFRGRGQPWEGEAATGPGCQGKVWGNRMAVPQRPPSVALVSLELCFEIRDSLVSPGSLHPREGGIAASERLCTAEEGTEGKESASWKFSLVHFKEGNFRHVASSLVVVNEMD